MADIMTRRTREDPDLAALELALADAPA